MLVSTDPDSLCQSEECPYKTGANWAAKIKEGQGWKTRNGKWEPNHLVRLDQVV